MFADASIFLDFNLPNATTWFYFSFLLAVAIFFKFGRLFSIRNLDVVSLFFLVPGVMIVQTAPRTSGSSPGSPVVHAAGLVGQSAVGAMAPGLSLAGGVEAYAVERREAIEDARWLRAGYIWLLIGSGIFFVRCLFDLVLVQRPLLAPNLTFGGLAWFGLALIVCLSAVAFRPSDRSGPRIEPGLGSFERKAGTESAPVTEARRWVAPTPVEMRAVAVVGQLAVVLALMMIGRVHFSDGSAGIAAAVFYLLLPYTANFVSQVDHVWPMAIILWGILAYRWPAASGFLLGLAAGVFYYPVVLLPLMLSFLWRRGAGRFLFFYLVSMAAVMGAVAFAYHVRGELNESIARAFELAAWQPWKTPPPDLEGFWTGIHAAYRIPVFLAYAAFVIATAFWPMPKNLGHVLALSTAVLIGTQFWYADKGGAYVLWYLPLYLLMVFRPNLEDRRPPEIRRETDWVSRSLAFVGRPLRRWFEPKAAAAPVVPGSTAQRRGA